MSDTHDHDEGHEGHEHTHAAEAAPAAAHVRAFWGTDYRRFMNIVLKARTEFGDEVADALAGPIVAALAADNPEFSADRFMVHTRPAPVMPQYVTALATALRTATHVKCEPWTNAPDEKVAAVTALGNDLAGVLATMVPEFTSETFMTSIRPPQSRDGGAAPGYTDPGDDDEDDDDQDPLV